MQKEVQLYSTNGFFPAPGMDKYSYINLMKTREAACRSFVEATKNSPNLALKLIGIENSEKGKYKIEVGIVPDCELLAVQGCSIPNVRVEYEQHTPEYDQGNHPISDLMEKRNSRKANAYKTWVEWDNVGIPLVVTTKRDGAKILREYGKEKGLEVSTPTSIHESIHAARSDLDLIGHGRLLVELFAQQFSVEEQMAALYGGLRDRRPKPYVQYDPMFNPDQTSSCVMIQFPIGDIKLEDLGERPTQQIRKKVQSMICEEHPDYKEAKRFLERLTTESFDGLFFYLPRYRHVFFVKPKGDSVEKRIIVAEAEEALRTEDSLTDIANSLGYAHTKFLRVISRLAYQEINTISDKLISGVSLEGAIEQTVEPWRMAVFGDLLARDDDVKLIRAPTRVGEDPFLLELAMHGTIMGRKPEGVKNRM